MSPRLELALQNGLLLSQSLSVICPTPDHNLSVLPKGVQVVQPFKPFHDHFGALGFETVPVAESPCQNALVFLPRAKALAKAMIQQASSRAGGYVVVDGAKTDGVDSILKDVRKRVSVEGPLSKAHGKIFWFYADAQAFADWAAPKAQMVDGYQTAPGVFSADGTDPASAMLLKTFPAKLGPRVADLGAGWGYLSAGILKRDGVKSVHLVEADHAALNCAHINASDPKARFYWSDAVTWTAPEPIDTVVMNPPFHTSRSADPALGQGFIAAAARNLTRNGTLWMVANRHLPYEATLNDHFAQVREAAGDNRFKVFQASRPRR
ncbi:class I SAM-dependent methyltransferase [uncultured Ruegeria sp.]|uniref:class I SAM-dependent methyltransferase n=1 Tax=uncultured Ruegeria sp. TaxID=259304 RepID=UPI0026216139|nr:class I SAM-dependent methyltransferase [uncultured Ruegeria sp.]